MGKTQIALGRHLNQIPEAELVPQVPAHTKNDDFAVEVPTCKQFLDAAPLAHSGPQFSEKTTLTRCDLCLHQNLSAEQKGEIWRRWKAGESLHEIGRAFDKDHGSIQFLLSKHGGIVPAIRLRSHRTLTLAEGEDISRGIAAGLSIREIARGLQRPASTVSREVARHGGRMVYRASEADDRALEVRSAAQAVLACPAQEAALDRGQ